MGSVFVTLQHEPKEKPSPRSTQEPGGAAGLGLTAQDPWGWRAVGFFCSFTCTCRYTQTTHSMSSWVKLRQSWFVLRSHKEEQRTVLPTLSGHYPFFLPLSRMLGPMGTHQAMTRFHGAHGLVSAITGQIGD